MIDPTQLRRERYDQLCRERDALLARLRLLDTPAVPVATPKLYASAELVERVQRRMAS